MNVIDKIIELLDLGRKIHSKDHNDIFLKILEDDTEALSKVVNLINVYVGNDRSEVAYDYFNNKININNAILRLVTDEKKEPMTTKLEGIVLPSAYTMDTAQIISLNSKRGRKGVYNEQSCIEALRAASKALGDGFNIAEYKEFAQKNKGYPSFKTIINHLAGQAGSWSRILTHAGVGRKKLKMVK